ncbi:MAG: ATP-binding cassette domain-containing protein [Oscillospiraceae bacterium]|nr:ATP-binding cassette domain-containing protein [Oscillospiraceae bacterium]
MSLKVKNLSKKYGEKTVVDNLNFEINEPGVYALLGTNGAGKTTSIRMILGMLSHDSGEILWKDKPLDAVACNVGYLAEERGLYPKYSLMDQLMYFAKLRGVSKAAALERIKYWSARFEVDEYIYPSKSSRGKKVPPKKPEQLSKGNQQKIQLISALISDPELLILDEPLSGLDPVNTDLFKSVIYEQIEKKKFLIMSSHQMPTVEEFCTDITILNKSKTVLQGNLNEIKKGYGRVHLFIKCEENIEDLITGCNIELIKRKESEYHLKVTGEEQANELLNRIIAKKIMLIKFELREPSLHEIFVEKVGGDNEEK